MLTHAPPEAPGPRDEQAEAAIEALREAVQAMRAFRAEHGVSPRDALVVSVSADRDTGLPADALAAIANVQMGDPGADALVIPISYGRILVQAPAVDIDAERARLESAIAAARTELARAEKQLSNEKFTSRAPAHLVDAERDKAQRFTSEIEELSARLDALG